MNLVHIGYPKTGTTWLQESGFHLLNDVAVLTDHTVTRLLNDLVTSEDTPAPALVRDYVQHYEGRGQSALLSYEDLSGQVWDGGLDANRTAKRLKQAFPDPTITVLIVVRAQPSMLLSLYAQYVNEGGWGSLPEFLEGKAEGLNWNPDYLAYDRLVDIYEDLFPERVVVLPYELLRSDPARFLTTVAGTMGTTLKTVQFERSTMNPSLVGWRLTFLRRWNRLFRASRFNAHPLLRVFGASRMRLILQAHRQRPHLVDQELVGFSERYEGSNARLKARCDLRGLGYPGVS